MIVISVIFIIFIIIMLLKMWSEKQRNHLLEMLILFNRKRKQNVCMCKNIIIVAIFDG